MIDTYWKCLTVPPKSSKGPEGPVVHLGGILGASMTKTGDLEWSIRKFQKKYPTFAGIFGCSDESDSSSKSNWFSKIVFCLSHFRNDLERRNLIAVGAAAGFAAAFAAPVGGNMGDCERRLFFPHRMLVVVSSGCSSRQTSAAFPLPCQGLRSSSLRRPPLVVAFKA